MKGHLRAVFDPPLALHCQRTEKGGKWASITQGTSHLFYLVLIPPGSVHLQHGHILALVDQEALVVDEVEGLKIDDHLRDNSKVSSLRSRVSLKPVCGRLSNIREDLNKKHHRNEENIRQAHLLEKRQATFARPDIIESDLIVLHLACNFFLLLSHSLLGICLGACLTVGIPLWLVILLKVVGDSSSH